MPTVLAAGVAMHSFSFPSAAESEEASPAAAPSRDQSSRSCYAIIAADATLEQLQQQHDEQALGLDSDEVTHLADRLDRILPEGHAQQGHGKECARASTVCSGPCRLRRRRKSFRGCLRRS